MLGFNHLGRTGHLANQMFQYAAIKGIAAHNCVPYMIPENDQIQLFNGFNMTTATTHRGFIGDTSVRDKDGAPVNCKIVEENSFAFDADLFNRSPENASLYGSFQSEKYFLNVWEDLQIDFVFKDKISDMCNELISQIRSPIVSVHVRRQDYLRLSEKHYNLPPEWFKAACDLFPSHMVLVLSDDIEWCREQSIFQGSRFLFSGSVDGKIKRRDGRLDSINMNHWYDLCLQTLCDDNIISNSSFSWWGAYLNSNSNKTVVSPNPKTKWFGPKNAHLNTSDLIPEHWVKL